MALIKRRYLFEADDDGGGDAGSTPSDPTVTSTDSSNSDDNSTDDASNDDTDDTSTDDSNDDSNSEDENSDDQDQNNDDEDYSIDAEPDADDSGDDSSSSDDNSSEDSSDDSGSNDNSEEKELDRQMFDTLSEDEKKRKIATLKKNFIDLHAKCDVLIEKFNQIEDEGNDDLDSIVKRILTILYDMKEYVSYYILNVFDKSSYIENDIMINRYISVLNGIKLTVEQLQKEKEKDNLQ